MGLLTLDWSRPDVKYSFRSIHLSAAKAKAAWTPGSSRTQYFFDLVQLVRGKRQVFDGGHIVLELSHAADADEGGGHPIVSQGPRQSHLRHGLVPSPGDFAEGTHLLQDIIAYLGRAQRARLARP